MSQYKIMLKSRRNAVSLSIKPLVAKYCIKGTCFLRNAFLFFSQSRAYFIIFFLLKYMLSIRHPSITRRVSLINQQLKKKPTNMSTDKRKQNKNRKKLCGITIGCLICISLLFIIYFTKERYEAEGTLPCRPAWEDMAIQQPSLLAEGGCVPTTSCSTLLSSLSLTLELFRSSDFHSSCACCSTVYNFLYTPFLQLRQSSDDYQNSC